MKIGFTGIELPEGKIKYKHERMDVLVEKDRPKKVSPFYVELVRDELIQTEAIVVPESSVIDLLIEDLIKCEARIERSDDEAEIRLMQNASGIWMKKFHCVTPIFPRRKRSSCVN